MKIGFLISWETLFDILSLSSINGGCLANCSLMTKCIFHGQINLKMHFLLVFCTRNGPATSHNLACGHTQKQHGDQWRTTITLIEKL